MKYRLYIAEVGNHDFNKSDDFKLRFLSLTGDLISLDHVRDVVHPEIEGLKYKHFLHHPDHLPLIFHRKELMNGNYPFERMRIPEVQQAFNQDFLQ
jgi:hypothetical protein